MSVALLRAAALVGVALVATSAHARDLTIVSFGGSYQDAQREIYFAPFADATGIAVIDEAYNGGVGVLRARAEGPPTWDVVQVETDELILGCEEGILLPLDWDALGADNFLPAAVHECAVGTIVWSTVMAYDADRFPENAPSTWADFFDVEAYPGMRGLRRSPRGALEFALMADGVPIDEVYAELATDEGIERAFAKLDTIKDSLILWEAGAQPPQLLAAGDVVMTSAYNGRITAANEGEGRNFAIAWGAGFSYAVDSWAIMANSDLQDEAMQFIQFASDPENQKLLPPRIPYGPTHVDAAALVDPAVQANIPTGPENLETGLFFDADFWVDRNEVLNERFNAWAAQ